MTKSSKFVESRIKKGISPLKTKPDTKAVRGTPKDEYEVNGKRWRRVWSR